MTDWRAENASDLRGLTLHRRKYTKWSEDWDHDHCAACGAEFAEFDAPNIQHEGYATGDDYPRGAAYEWVCLRCFNDLKTEMEWSESPLP